ncbi:MAG: galactonate dehydratase [Clostridia bacterium]|nr:galactonate dehydratase [Clostridia bacterium]
MKITDIKPYIVQAHNDNWVYVKVHTDGALTGVGECSLETREQTVVAAVLELKRHLLGRDPLEIEKNFYLCFRDAYWGAGCVLTSALSAVDTALWDIKGKALDTPVYQLLGGKFRDKIRVYANRWFFGGDTPDQLAALAEKTVKKGYTAMKWDPFYKAEGVITAKELRGVVAQIKALRGAVGWDIDLLVEGHGRFNPYTALQIAEELKPYRPFFFEEPTLPENVDSCAQVKARSPIPIASGERWCTISDYRAAIEAKAIDIAQPDIRVCGGITQMKKIAALCEANHIPLAPHNIHGQVGCAASMHVAAAIPNALILEYSVEEIEWKESLFTHQYKPKDGYMYINDRPGIGIDFNEAAAARYPFKNISMVQNLYPTEF